MPDERGGRGQGSAAQWPGRETQAEFVALGEGAHLLGGAVATADEGTTFDPAEAHGEALLTDAVEFGGQVEALDGEVLAAGLQVLADGEDVDVAGAEVAQWWRGARPCFRRGRP